MSEQGRGRRTAEQLKRKARDAQQRRTPFRGVVVAIDASGTVSLKEYDSDESVETPFQQPIKVARGATFKAGDQVLVIPSGDGRDYTALGISDTNDGGIRVESATVPIGGASKKWGALDFSAAFALVIEDAAGIDSDVDEINVDLAPIVDQNLRGSIPFITDGTPVTATNSSTSTFASLASFTVDFGSGTWTAYSAMVATFKNNTANDGAQFRWSSPSTSGTVSDTSPTANATFTLLNGTSTNGLTGVTTFSAEYRAATGGTAAPVRWLAIIIARRTA